MADTISRRIRKIEDKTEDEKFQIRNIDFIYLINLDKRPERLARCMAQFAPYKIRPHRFPGIDGWAYTQEVFNDVAMTLLPSMQYDRPVHFRFVTGAYPGQRITESSYGKPCVHAGSSAGGIGGAMGHLSILDDAYNAGYETIWILEDDFTINCNPHILADYLDRLDQLAPDWDLLYTDDDDYFTASNVAGNFSAETWLRPGMPMTDALVERTPVGEDFFKIGGRTQAHSVIYKRRGVKKIVDHLKQNNFFLPYDTELPCVKDLKMYNLKEDLVHGRDRNSSHTSRWRP